ncbi:MAG: PilN domain-containing protein, partial [Armatimonadota bacterium]
LFAVIGEVALLVLLVSFMGASAFQMNRQIRQLDKDLEKIQPTVNKIKQYESSIKELEPRLDLLADSRESTLLWHTVLTDLSRSMPDKTWLVNLSTSMVQEATDSEENPEPKLVLNIKGTSGSQREVGEAMLRLGQFREIDKVDLNYTQGAASQEMDAVEFDIAASLKTAKGGG